MKRRRVLDIIQVDAFTDTPYGGNPAAVVLGADTLSTERMNQIALEMSVRETVFVCNSEIANFSFHYWTPKSEIDFSGHATIAAFHAMVERGLVEVVQDVMLFNLETRTGILPVEVVKNEATGAYEVQITHAKPKFMSTYDPKEYTKALGLTLADMMSPNPIQTVSTGTPFLMVPLSTLRAVKKVQPNWSSLQKLHEKGDYLGIHVFSRETNEVTSDVHARTFVPALGLPEDPVSGAAAGCMASYIIRYGLMEPTIPVTSIVLEQGHSMGRPGKVFVEVRGDQEGIDQVKVSGTGVTILEGKIYI